MMSVLHKTWLSYIVSAKNQSFEHNIKDVFLSLFGQTIWMNSSNKSYKKVNSQETVNHTRVSNPIILYSLSITLSSGTRTTSPTWQRNMQKTQEVTSCQTILLLRVPCNHKSKFVWISTCEIPFQKKKSTCEIVCESL